MRSKERELKRKSTATEFKKNNRERVREEKNRQKEKNRESFREKKNKKCKRNGNAEQREKIKENWK